MRETFVGNGAHAGIDGWDRGSQPILGLVSITGRGVAVELVEKIASAIIPANPVGQKRNEGIKLEGRLQSILFCAHAHPKNYPGNRTFTFKLPKNEF